MAERKDDEYGVDEAARILGLSPERVRQMLRSGKLEGERPEERIEGVLGPWRIHQEATLRESLERESERADRGRERADGLRAELDAERAHRGEEPREARRRLFAVGETSEFLTGWRRLRCTPDKAPAARSSQRR